MVSARLCPLAAFALLACRPTPSTPVGPPAASPSPARADPIAPSTGAPTRLAAAAIAASSSHGCALAEDASVQCWGRNSGGALGNGRTQGEESTPMRVPGIDRVRAIAVDRLRTCVVHDEGRVRCWGDRLVFEKNGQWLVGGTTTPQPIGGITNAASVVFGGRDACMLLEDGTARCFGDVDSPLRTPARTDEPLYTPSLPANTTGLVLGGEHACALDRDGAVWCWGSNAQGELGTGDTRPRTTPTRVGGLPPLVAIAAAGTVTCGVTRSGALSCWGGTRCPANGDCAIPDVAVTRPRAIAVAATLGDVELSLAGGMLLDDGGHAWAFDPLAALHSGAPPQRIAGVAELAQVAIGAEICGRTRGGEVLCWPRGAAEVTPRVLAMQAR